MGGVSGDRVFVVVVVLKIKFEVYSRASHIANIDIVYLYCTLIHMIEWSQIRRRHLAVHLSMLVCIFVK